MSIEFPSDRVLITGHTGWLGQALCQALVQGFPDLPNLATPARPFLIRGLAAAAPDPETPSASSSIVSLTGDLTDPKACAALCEGAAGATLFHIAGLVHPQRVRDFYRVNVQGTEHLLRAAVHAGVRRAVIVSSNSPCGSNPHPDHRFDESSPYHPYMNYGRSKQQMEQVVQRFQQSGELETVIVRAPWFYGPWQPARQTLFFHMIRQGKMPLLGNGENLRSMSYTDNLAQGLVLAAQVPAAAGRTFWIADQRPYSMNEIIHTVEQLLETEFQRPCARKRVHLPTLVGHVATAVDFTLQGCGLYHQKFHVLSEMHRTIACSVATAQRDLGYNPQVDLREGMRRSLAWCAHRGLI
jgi:nucleoside-diphosphate-sugar epimerase